MPLHSLIQLQLESVPERHVLLNNAIHGLIHQVLTLAPTDPNSDVNPATWLHEAQRQALSLRGFELIGSVLRLEVVTLSDELASSVAFVFQEGHVFGREDDVLRGVVLSGLHRGFMLESLMQRVRSFAPARRLRLEFLSPTAFTHKRGTWASPHPTLLFGSLLARWSDFCAVPLQVQTDCIVKAVPGISSGVTQIGANPMPAFEGCLDLELIGDDDARFDLTTLVVFASIAGTGRRVAYGCGALRATAFLARTELLLEPDFVLA